MPKGGSKPGERRGGRQKGTPNRKTVERQLIAERMLQHPPAGIESGKLGREVLAQYMNTFDELAEQYRKADEAKFRQIRGTRSRVREGTGTLSIADLPRH